MFSVGRGTVTETKAGPIHKGGARFFKRDSRFDAILDSTLLASLPSIAIGLVLLYTAFTVLHLLSLPESLRARMVAVSSSTVLVLAAGWVALIRQRVPVRWAHPSAGIIGALVLTNSLIHFYLTKDIHQATNLALLLIGFSCFVYSIGWHLIIAILSLAGWGVGVAVIGLAPEVLHFSVMLLTCAVLSVTILTVRIRAERKIHGYQDHLEDLVRAQTEELRQEIQDRMRAEETIRKSEVRFRLLAENAQDIIFRFRLGAVPGFEYVSPSVQSILGHSPADFYQNPHLLEQILEPDYRHQWSELLRSPVTRPPVSTVSVRRQDGEIVWLEQRNKLVLEESGQVAVIEGIARDVSERKRAEAEKMRLEEELQKAQKLEALGRLSAGIAHNFNNLLAGIAGNVALARLQAPESSQENLEHAEAATQRAAQLVRELMLFGRSTEPEKSAVQVGRVAREVLAICRGTFDRRIVLTLEECADIPCALANRSRLHQVFLNLCINARDAVEEIRDRTPQIVLRIGVIRGEGSEWVSVEVEDNGVGIPRNQIDRVFDPFFTTKAIGKGTGLGLTTVYGIVQQHGGRIKVESEPGLGTRFTVTLPTTETHETIERAVDDAQPSGHETLLVIDDEEMIRAFSKEVLERGGYSVLTAENGTEGLERFRKHQKQIKLVILDLSMPGYSGREVLREMLSIAPSTKVVVSTGYGVDRKELPGAKAVLSKPYACAVLLQTVRKVLDSTGRA